MLLHDYFRSSAGYRVRIALNLKRVAYSRREVMLLEGEQRAPAHLARNPQGLVPALELDDGSVLTQSFAILDWLDHAHPDPRLIPEAPKPRARALAMALAIACDIHPLNNLRVLDRLTEQFGADADTRGEWYRHWVAEGLAALETLAGGETSEGPYLGGQAPDIADVFLVPQMFNARRFGVDLSPYPRLRRADEAACALEAFAAAHPDRMAP